MANDDPTQPECLRVFLDRARSTAHGHLSDEPFPKLFATYRGESWGGVKTGERVRIVMASRMGDVGCRKDFKTEFGYTLRAYLEYFSDFSSEP